MIYDGVLPWTAVKDYQVVKGKKQLHRKKGKEKWKQNHYYFFLRKEIIQRRLSIFKVVWCNYWGEQYESSLKNLIWNYHVIQQSHSLVYTQAQP